MKSITKKLSRQNGASILMAMVLFLICGFVAAVTLGAATTNAQKYTDQRRQQQCYLSVSSAARMLEDILGEKEFTGKEEKWIYYCRDDLSEYDSISPACESDRVEICDHLEPNDDKNYIPAVIGKGMYDVYLSKKRYKESKPFKGWTQEMKIEAPDMYAVTAVASIDRDYQLTITLRTAEPEIDNDEYAMTLTFKASETNNEIINNFSCDPPHSGYKMVEQDDGTEKEEYFEELQSTRNEHYTNITVIKLTKGDIRKGV